MIRKWVLAEKNMKAIEKVDSNFFCISAKLDQYVCLLLNRIDYSSPSFFGSCFYTTLHVSKYTVVHLFYPSNLFYPTLILYESHLFISFITQLSAWNLIFVDTMKFSVFIRLLDPLIREHTREHFDTRRNTQGIATANINDTNDDIVVPIHITKCIQPPRSSRTHIHTNLFGNTHTHTHNRLHNILQFMDVALKPRASIPCVWQCDTADNEKCKRYCMKTRQA